MWLWLEGSTNRVQAGAMRSALPSGCDAFFCAVRLLEHQKSKAFHHLQARLKLITDELRKKSIAPKDEFVKYAGYDESQKHFSHASGFQRISSYSH